VRIRWTEQQGDAERIAREAASEADIVAALGGDGTCNEVVNGLMGPEGPINPRVVFATLPFGTGGDLVRTLEIPRSLPDALWVAATGTTLHVDVGRVAWQSGESRWFINVAGAGANAEVCERVNRSGKRWGGTLTFLGAILSTVREFQPQEVTWRWSGSAGDGECRMATLAAFVANAHYCGAGLWVGRGGSMADGEFDVTLLPPLAFTQALLALPHTRSGRLEAIPGAVRFRAGSIDLVGALPIETDGEPRGPGPASFSIRPHALQVRGAWRRPPVG
jgi:diacylglycerol kinase family enzyme